MRPRRRNGTPRSLFFFEAGEAVVANDRSDKNDWKEPVIRPLLLQAVVVVVRNVRRTSAGAGAVSTRLAAWEKEEPSLID